MIRTKPAIFKIVIVTFCVLCFVYGYFYIKQAISNEICNTDEISSGYDYVRSAKSYAKLNLTGKAKLLANASGPSCCIVLKAGDYDVIGTKVVHLFYAGTGGRDRMEGRFTVSKCGQVTDYNIRRGVVP